MPSNQLHVVSPDLLTEFVQAQPLLGAFEQIAGLAGAEFRVSEGRAESLGCAERLVCYNGRSAGSVFYSGSLPKRDGGSVGALDRAAAAMSGVLEHMLDRESAVADLAEALVTSYEELNVLYTLLPNIATRVNPRQVAEVLVEQAAQTLHCERVSLLVLDERRENLTVLASRGLPACVGELSIPVTGSVAEYALLEDLLVVNDAETCPEITNRSRGQYDGAAFAVARVPLRAQGQAVGVLTATERRGSAEFTARDRKLLEGFSAMGASALLNCQLHAAINRQMMSTIQALACAVDAKDQYTHDHSGRVARLCVSTARLLGVRDDAICREIELSGLLHDIGKIGIPDAILSKPDRLTPEEFEVIKSHVRIGAGIVGKVQGLESVARAILHHHERYDGLGYPDGLVRDEIPLASKLIAASDTYDSLTSDRAYRKATTSENGLRELNRCKGMQFDPAIVEALAAVVEHEETESAASRAPASGGSPQPSAGR
jgi:putative nucleotidyltransferase with HDIG domain